jgi:hypothetical protein
MAAQSDDIRVLRFSSDELPERDRLAIVREVHGRLTARVDIEPAPDAPMHYRAIARTLPGLIVSLLSVSPHTVRRTRELLADGSDDVVFVLSPTGGNMVSQLGRELSHIAGDAVLMSTRTSCALMCWGLKSVSSPYRVEGWRRWFRGSKTRSCGLSHGTPKPCNCWPGTSASSTTRRVWRPPNCAALWLIMSTILSRLRSGRRAMLL